MLFRSMRHQGERMDLTSAQVGRKLAGKESREILAEHEGVAAAAAIRALGGDMQARLIPRNEVKGDTEENRKIAAEEVQRCEALGVKVNEILKLEDLVRDDNLVFAATGITHGELLKGISRRGNLATTETLLIRGKSRTIRKIQSIHYLDRKDSEIYEILRN